MSGMEILYYILIFVMLLLLLGLLWPRKAYIENESLVLSSFLSKTEIALAEMEFVEIPEGLLKNSIRLYGLSILKYQSGTFYNYRMKLKYEVFLYKKEKPLCFKHDGRYHVVNINQ